MARETDFIASLRAMASHSAARGLMDDAAVLPLGNEQLIMTHDMMVEGTHWLPGADPADVAWKLVAVNLSDLAAKGAQPLGVLLGFMLGDDAWDRAFAKGLAAACAHFDVPLLGGDTVAATGVQPRALGLTALGRATSVHVPDRRGAWPVDALWITGPVGDAMAGYRMLTSENAPAPAPALSGLVAAFSRPLPLIATGQALAPVVGAMMDISDGLLIDARRMALASGLCVDIASASVPLSDAFLAWAAKAPEGPEKARAAALRWGDDYQLLFAAPANAVLPAQATRIGRFIAPSATRPAGTLLIDGAPPAADAPLGYLHG